MDDSKEFHTYFEEKLKKYGGRVSIIRFDSSNHDKHSDDQPDGFRIKLSVNPPLKIIPENTQETKHGVILFNEDEITVDGGYFDEILKNIDDVLRLN